MNQNHCLRQLPIIGAVGIAVLAAACGGPAGGDGASAPKQAVSFGDTTAAATADLEAATWMLPKEPSTLDIDRSDGNSDANTVMANVCERLMQLQPDLSTKPHLAQSITWATPLTAVFKLRTDVTFHDGTPMTADDVLWSMRRHAEDGMDESDEYANVRSIEKTGDHEITVTMTQPDAVFVQAMAGNGGVVLNRKVLEAAGDKYGSPGSRDACSGPYQLGEWGSGSQLTLDKAPAYWNADRTARTSKITFRWADQSAVVNSLTSGEADGAYLDNAAAAVPLLKNKQLTVAQGPSTNVWSFLVTERGALKDQRIRQALALALDREGIVKAAFGGLATPWKAPVGPGAWGYEKTAFQSAYDELGGAPGSPGAADLEKAKALVGTAGGPTQPIVIASDGDSARNTMANALVDAAGKIGLKAEIITIPRQQYGDFYSDKTLRARADLFSDEYYISKNDPIGFYKNGASTARVNYVGFSDPQYDAMVKKAQQTTDNAARAVLAIDLQARWTEAMPWIPVVQTPSTVALSRKVTGVPSSASFLYYPWAADLGATGSQ